MSEKPKKTGRISNVVCPNCKHSLDDVIESMIRQRGKFKGQRESARAERDEARAEVERLQELAATATRAHTRAIHALAGNCEYPADERREMGLYLTQELQRRAASREETQSRG